MELYSILAIFFLIGAVGIALINKKSSHTLENKNRWKKYLVYLLLVFAQLFLIENKAYPYFGLLIVAVGFLEIIKAGKTMKSKFIGLLFYCLIGWFFFSFLAEAKVWQQFLFVIVITFDGYSQLFGQLFGKVKLFPKMSPNKTLEGLLGGMVSVLVTAIILSYSLNIQLSLAIAFGLLIAIFAVIGDFLASVYKRRNDIKDYSQLIPHHGGVLDRFDSLIFAGFGFTLLLEIDFESSLVLIFALYVLLFLMLFLIAEVLHHSLGCKAELSRKFVHFTSGVICLSFPLYLDNHWVVLVLCLGFLLILLISQQLKVLKSINGINRKSYGSVLFPVAVYCCFLVFQYHDNQQVYFYLPILILAICDPLAALIGKKYPFWKYKSGKEYKTIMGSLAFFSACFLIVFITFYSNEITLGALLIVSFFLSVTSTLAEAFSRNGTDNLFIPLAVLMMLNVL